MVFGLIDILKSLRKRFCEKQKPDINQVSPLEQKSEDIKLVNRDSDQEGSKNLHISKRVESKKVEQ